MSIQHTVPQEINLSYNKVSSSRLSNLGSNVGPGRAAGLHTIEGVDVGLTGWVNWKLLTGEKKTAEECLHNRHLCFVPAYITGFWLKTHVSSHMEGSLLDTFWWKPQNASGSKVRTGQERDKPPFRLLNAACLQEVFENNMAQHTEQQSRNWCSKLWDCAAWQKINKHPRSWTILDDCCTFIALPLLKSSRNTRTADQADQRLSWRTLGPSTFKTACWIWINLIYLDLFSTLFGNFANPCLGIPFHTQAHRGWCLLTHT